MANTADISRGMILKMDGSLYTVVEFEENKTARAAAKVWAKLKGLIITVRLKKLEFRG